VNESPPLSGEGEEKSVRDIGKILQPSVIGKSLIKGDINHGINDINYSKVKTRMNLAS
jgi:hypothetical protein